MNLETKQSNYGTNNIEFEAHYNYGSKSEQLQKKNFIVDFFHTTMTRIIKLLVFPGASIKKNIYIDSERIQKAEEQLEFMGGKQITLKTPDGDFLNGMHIQAKDFKAQLEKYCDVVDVLDEDQTVHKRLILKKEYYYLNEEPSLNQFKFQNLKHLSFSIVPQVLASIVQLRNFYKKILL